MSQKSKINKKKKRVNKKHFETGSPYESGRSSDAPQDSDKDSLPSPLPGAESISNSSVASGLGKRDSSEFGKKEEIDEAQQPLKRDDPVIKVPSSHSSSNGAPSSSNRLSQIYDWVSEKTFGKSQASESEKFISNDSSNKLLLDESMVTLEPTSTESIDTSPKNSDVLESTTNASLPHNSFNSVSLKQTANSNINSLTTSVQQTVQHFDEYPEASANAKSLKHESKIEKRSRSLEVELVVESSVSTRATSGEAASHRTNSFPPIKKQVRFLNVSEANETTPLIVSPQPSSHTFPVTPAPSRTMINKTRNLRNHKPQIWMWVLVGGLLFLGNVALLTFLFLDPKGYNSSLESLLSQMDLQRLQTDLEMFQSFADNREASGNIVSGESELAGANYISDQLEQLPGFDVEVQHFSKPQWSLSALPSMAVYFDWQVPLEFQRDFIVIPFSGGTSGLRRLKTVILASDSCSLYDHRVRGRAVLVPYLNTNRYGISTPCPVWDLAFSAQEAGAAAVIFYLQDEHFPKFDDSTYPQLLPPEWQPGGSVLDIPVVLVTRLSGELLRTEPLGLPIDIDVSISFVMRLSRNLVAKLKNHSDAPHVDPAHRPVIMGTHWDSDPLTTDASHFQVTGAAGLLEAARAIHSAGYHLKSHPIHLVWFGARSPLNLGLKKYLDSLTLAGGTSLWPYFYLDLGRLEGERPCLFDSSKAPAMLRHISSKAQKSMEDSIKYEINRPGRKGPIPKIPLYNYDGLLGVPEMAFMKYNVSATGISSLNNSNSAEFHSEMVLQLTEVALIAIDKIFS